MLKLLALLCALSLIALAGCAVPAGGAADLYVSPEGNDAWSGRLPAPNADGTDGPLATVAKARDTVRAIRAESPARDTPVTVLLRGGRYELNETLELGPEDSNTTYAAFPGDVLSCIEQ